MGKYLNCLKKYRKARGLTQNEVAKVLGFKSTSMISRWERGLSIPSTMNLFRLAVLYRTMADALFIDLRKALEKELHEKEEALKSKHES
jgi:transcriptional regulator with XRE-family HTH domain